jgi:hypothetical protein
MSLPTEQLARTPARAAGLAGSISTSDADAAAATATINRRTFMFVS